MAGNRQVIIDALYADSDRARWISNQDALSIARDVDDALARSGAYDAHAQAELEYDEKVKAAAVRDFCAWLAEHTDEIVTQRLETEEDKGVNITTDVHVERWLDDMVEVWIKEQL